MKKYDIGRLSSRLEKVAQLNKLRPKQTAQQKVFDDAYTRLISEMKAAVISSYKQKLSSKQEDLDLDAKEQNTRKELSEAVETAAQDNNEKFNQRQTIVKHQPKEPDIDPSFHGYPNIPETPKDQRRKNELAAQDVLRNALDEQVGLNQALKNAEQEVENADYQRLITDDLDWEIDELADYRDKRKYEIAFYKQVFEEGQKLRQLQSQVENIWDRDLSQIDMNEKVKNNISFDQGELDLASQAVSQLPEINKSLQSLNSRAPSARSKSTVEILRQKLKQQRSRDFTKDMVYQYNVISYRQKTPTARDRKRRESRRWMSIQNQIERLQSVRSRTKQLQEQGYKSSRSRMPLSVPRAPSAENIKPKADYLQLHKRRAQTNRQSDLATQSQVNLTPFKLPNPAKQDKPSAYPWKIHEAVMAQGIRRTKSVLSNHLNRPSV